MKSKLLIFIIIVTCMLSVSVPAIASSVVDITRPEGNEIVTKDIFSICGICIYDETTIAFEYKDRDSGEYKTLLTTDGESSFKVGNNKIFGKDIQLKYKGDNEIRVIAYTKATQSKPQVNDYTITLAEKNKNSSWIADALKWFGFSDESKQ